MKSWAKLVSSNSKQNDMENHEFRKEERRKIVSAIIVFALPRDSKAMALTILVLDYAESRRCMHSKNLMICDKQDNC